jgi:hypothetical protein
MYGLCLKVIDTQIFPFHFVLNLSIFLSLSRSLARFQAEHIFYHRFCLHFIENVSSVNGVVVVVDDLTSNYLC